MFSENFPSEFLGEVTFCPAQNILKRDSLNPCETLLMRCQLCCDECCRRVVIALSRKLSPALPSAVEKSLTLVRSRASGWIFGFDRALFRRVMRHEFVHLDTKRSVARLPREALIAVSLAQQSVVKVEVEGRQGETTLTTRSEPYNRTAIHAGLILSASLLA